ncbi:alcohol dehydrogenase [Apiospora arundinis]
MLHQVFLPDIPLRPDLVAAIDVAREWCLSVDFLHMFGEGCLGRERLLCQLLRQMKIVEGVVTEELASMVQTSRELTLSKRLGAGTGSGDILVVKFVIATKMLD